MSCKSLSSAFSHKDAVIYILQICPFAQHYKQAVKGNVHIHDNNKTTPTLPSRCRDIQNQNRNRTQSTTTTILLPLLQFVDATQDPRQSLSVACRRHSSFSDVLHCDQPNMSVGKKAPAMASWSHERHGADRSTVHRNCYDTDNELQRRFRQLGIYCHHNDTCNNISKNAYHDVSENFSHGTTLSCTRRLGQLERQKQGDRKHEQHHYRTRRYPITNTASVSKDSSRSATLTTQEYVADMCPWSTFFPSHAVIAVHVPSM